MRPVAAWLDKLRKKSLFDLENVGQGLKPQGSFNDLRYD